jgi:diadenosine tetraphosphate (Ap4A) HIT family hydrolase
MSPESCPYHLHVVPRFENDGITLAWDNTVVERARLDSLADEIRRHVEPC